MHYAVFGNPIAHSKSPQIHAAFAAEFGLPDFQYDKLLAPLDGFGTAVREFVAVGGAGCNVTVPFKEEAFRLAEVLSARARAAGAVNTLMVQADGSLFGDNTDGAGLVADLLRHVPLQGKRLLLLGAGGAARGALLPLLAEQPALLVIANRTVARARALSEDVVQPWLAATGLPAELLPAHGVATFDFLIGGVPLEVTGGASPVRALGKRGVQFDVVINATSASLGGEAIPMAPDVFAADAVAYDMMYGKDETAFLAQARVAGVATRVDGLGMLVGQAAEAFTLWTGHRPDVAPVLATLRAAL
ncbi:MAG TPA: shikimate dehydrogenase [Chitinolyticbacter sp.]|nr:shikimate dehydrogenase [Chitinolyticbacter sp.]